MAAERRPRDAYGNALLAMAADGVSVVVVDGDSASATRASLFAAEYPNLCVNVGLSEQDMILTAAGLALGGKNVYVILRLLSRGSGVRADPILCGHSASGEDRKEPLRHHRKEDGPYQMLEDVALMRVLPGMTVLAPAGLHVGLCLLTSAAGSRGPSISASAGRRRRTCTTTGFGLRAGRGRVLGTRTT